jgi:SIR2-like domain
MSSHNPHEFANSLSGKLAARSRHVCLLAGAGVARACGLPDVGTLQSAILAALPDTDRELFQAQLGTGNIEQALSRLRRIASLIEGDEETIGGLTGAAAQRLDLAVCELIVDQLDLAAADLGPVLNLASWAARADYHLPLELFTVNYDLLIETALEKMGVAYFDGFVGALHARFRTDLVEASPDQPSEWLPSFLVRLWKLHGSVNWQWSADGRPDVIRLGAAVAPANVAAIYPSDTKYDESRRVPFVVLQDRFRRALYSPESLVLITGYSWRDEHLNELIFEAAVRRPRSELIAFAHSEIPEVLAVRARALPNLQVASPKLAILGGTHGDWEAPDEELPEVWEQDSFAPADFAHLASFLARSSPPQADIDRRLDELTSAGGQPA